MSSYRYQRHETEGHGDIEGIVGLVHWSDTWVVTAVVKQFAGTVNNKSYYQQYLHIVHRSETWIVTAVVTQRAGEVNNKIYYQEYLQKVHR